MAGSVKGHAHIGYVVLVAALALPVVYGVVLGADIGTFGIEVARQTSTLEDFCRALDYYGRCNAELVYIWLLSRLGPSFISLNAISALSVLATFVFARRVAGSHLASGLAALIYALTPLVLSRLYDQSGLLHASLLLPLVLALIYEGAVSARFKSLFTTLGVVLYALLALHPASPLVLIALSALLVVKQDAVAAELRKALLAMVLLSAIITLLGSILGLGYTPFMVSSTIIAGLSIAYSSVQGPVSASYRLAAGVALVLASVAVILLECSFISTRAEAELNPLYTWGLAGFLGLPGALIATTRPRNAEEARTAVLAFLLPPLSTLVALSHALVAFTLSISACSVLQRAEDFLAEAAKHGKRRWQGALALLLLLSIAVASLPGSFVVAAELDARSLPFADLPEPLRKQASVRELSRALKLVESEMSSAIRQSSTSNRVLVLSTLENSYWIASALAEHGLTPQLIASPHSSEGSRSLLARIMVSSEEEAVLVLRKVTEGLGTRDVYVVLVFPYSIKEADKSAYIGIPREAVLPYGGGLYPTQLFDAYGDLAAFTQLVTAANKTLGEYFFLTRERELEKSQPLFWTVKGSETLFAQLLVKALNEVSPAVYNYMMGGGELNSTIRYFEAVYLKKVEVGKVRTTYYGDYTVYYMLAVFKLKGE
ncbi:MAG: hypothetical protein ACP5KA_02180 [Desulfurococcaceae archaeon]